VEVRRRLVNSDPGEPRDCVKTSMVFVVWNMMCSVSTLQVRIASVKCMRSSELEDLVQLRHACDLMDRDYSRPLAISDMARASNMSSANFSRKFRLAYGETPYTYLLKTRIERAQALLRDGESVTSVCFAVGYLSLASFSARFTQVIGVSPSDDRLRDHSDLEMLAPCVRRVATRPKGNRALLVPSH
jgi:AraC-like DNA-binding protein